MNKRKIRQKGAKPNKIPAEVATALPPLKLAKIGKVCPKIAKKPNSKGEMWVTSFWA